MRVRVVAFARVAEVLGWRSREIALAPGAAAGTVWQELQRDEPGLAALADSTRLARNGRIVDAAEPLRENDELALLPPAGGG